MAAEVIVFPDVEDALRLHYLAKFAARAPFASVGAYAATRPATFPPEFVFVHRTGGTRRGLVVDVVQVTVEAYAKTGGRAHDIAQLARGLLAAAALDGALGDVTVYGVEEMSGPYLDPDPNAPTFYRYTATSRVAVRGVAA